MTQNSPLPLTFSDPAPEGSLSTNLRQLIAGRLFIHADSGGGKSLVLRQLAEQTFSRIQQFIIDPEGEFANLRETGEYPYLLVSAGSDGDIQADARQASTLCRALLDLQTSAIFDLSELEETEQQEYVAQMLTPLVGPERNGTAKPLLVIVDELQIFAPENSLAEAVSLDPLSALSKRGRKRAICFAGASQRPSEVSKRVISGVQNRIVGITVQDTDLTRAATALGFAPRRRHELMNLEPGEFFTFGRAFSPRSATLVRSGPTRTRHPEVGEPLPPAPPPPDEIRQVLASLQSLAPGSESPTDSTPDTLRRQIRSLQQQLQKNQEEFEAFRSHALLEKRQIQRQKDATQGLLQMALEILRGETEGLQVPSIRTEEANALPSDTLKGERAPDPLPLEPPDQTAEPAGSPAQAAPAQAAPEDEEEEGPTDKKLPRDSRTTRRPTPRDRKRILQSLRHFEETGLRNVHPYNLAVSMSVSPLSSSYRELVRILVRDGLVSRSPQGTISLTDTGRQETVPRTNAVQETPHPHAILHQSWIRYLERVNPVLADLLKSLLDAYPQDLSHEEAAQAAQRSVRSSSTREALRGLRTKYNLALRTGPERIGLNPDMLLPQLQEQP